MGVESASIESTWRINMIVSVIIYYMQFGLVSKLYQKILFMFVRSTYEYSYEVRVLRYAIWGTVLVRVLVPCRTKGFSIRIRTYSIVMLSGDAAVARDERKVTHAATSLVFLPSTENAQFPRSHH
eukprot:scaffold68807_cov17-Prasinocladus_malaysianus.AAC.1